MTLGAVIGTILRHDVKTASYKIALIRSLNDVALGFPQVSADGPIAVPLRFLAEFWLAYYWPFTLGKTILQAYPQSGKQDISFRGALEQLQQHWAKAVGNPQPADGFFLMSEMRSLRRRRSYPLELQNAYDHALEAIQTAIKQPIQYAGPGRWGVFARPQRWQQLQGSGVVALPGTLLGDVCVVIQAQLWHEFNQLSLWIEALCLHEWCLFTEDVSGYSRGHAYELLTSRPDNRRPLTWERNQVEILMMEGHRFVCPYTGKNLSTRNYDMDHIIPLAVYPINELWNLVPSDRQFNQHQKRTRLPSAQRLIEVQPRLEDCYSLYGLSPSLWETLQHDASKRFGLPHAAKPHTWLAQSVTELVDNVATSRNLARF